MRCQLLYVNGVEILESVGGRTGKSENQRPEQNHPQVSTIGKQEGSGACEEVEGAVSELEAMKVLGYTQKMWDEEKSTPEAVDKDWEKLSAAQKIAMKALDWRSESWDEAAVSAPKTRADSPKPVAWATAQAKHWKDLQAKVMKVAPDITCPSDWAPLGENLLGAGGLEAPNSRACRGVRLADHEWKEGTFEAPCSPPPVYMFEASNRCVGEGGRGPNQALVKLWSDA